jgi:hypothetical protein
MENLKEATQESLQNYILEGRKILLKKPNEKQKIQIRFNHWDVDGTRKWRVIVDGIEFHTSEIKITTDSRTESEYFEDLKEYKHHIIVDANQVEFNKNIANIS